MARTWKALRIKFGAEAGELIPAVLWDLGMLGSTTEAEDREAVTLLAYFAPETKPAALVKRLKAALQDYAADRLVRRIETLEIKDEDWLRRWKESFTAFTVGDRFRIAPTWEKVPTGEGRLVLRIDPEMAFGSGTHESTQLGLLAIEKYYEPGMTLLDIGTGSGILALAAAKILAHATLGARQAGKKSITAIDEDPLAVQVATKNFRRNRVLPYIAPAVGALGKTRLKPYDFVVANLTAKDLITYRRALLKTLKRNAWLVLSGILSDQDKEVLRAFAGPWTRVDKLYLNEWFGAVLRRRAD